MMLQTQIFSPAPEFGNNFSIGGHNLTFGPQEFCLITGLVFGEQTPEITVRGKSFKDRLFGDKKDHNLTMYDLYLFRNHLDILDDVDAIRICLLLLVEHGFKGGEGQIFVDKTMLYLVNDLGAWNTFPWGSYPWRNTYPYIHDALQKNSRQNRKPMLNYSLKGFTWAFKSPQDLFTPLNETNDFKDPFTLLGGNQFIYQNTNVATPSVVEMNFECEINLRVLEKLTAFRWPSRMVGDKSPMNVPERHMNTLDENEHVVVPNVLNDLVVAPQPANLHVNAPHPLEDDPLPDMDPSEWSDGDNDVFWNWAFGNLFPENIPQDENFK
ncbi:hypothetical protein E3N88_06685 [Mikania micrantha]|uniref:DUF1985 domain-containing protein n=1 Tax=Mikania micrantha TaxID=192012 RepID=A0A5N6PSC4_9ASTR|nr:hypothetical protein E3N88_06685 [Mikania micrantha]